MKSSKARRGIKLLIFVLILFVVFIIMASIEISKNKEQTVIRTVDGYTISYTFNEVSDKAVILVHMLSKNKEDYNELAGFLNQNGYSTIAFDLRGHGNSQGDLQSFNDKDFQDMALDLKAVKLFLTEKKIKEVSIVGASIGANLALNFAAQTDIKKLVLLSPGENYHGVTITQALGIYKNPILFVASKDDPYAYKSTENAVISYKGSKDFISYESAGHGTNMFAKHPELKQTILDFLKN